LEYRGDLGSDATPEDIASMAASYFGWPSDPVLTSEGYVRAVMTGHGHAKRQLLSDFHMLMEEAPKSLEEANLKWSAIKEWVSKEKRTLPSAEKTLLLGIKDISSETLMNTRRTICILVKNDNVK